MAATPAPWRAIHPSANAAEDFLHARGFHRRGGLWAKPSRVDPAAGGYARLALVSVQRRHVAPEYRRPDYYELLFV